MLFCRYEPRRSLGYREEDKSGTKVLLHDILVGSVIIFIVVVVVSLLRCFVIGDFSIPSSSMDPTLKVKDTAVVIKLSEVHRGDVVVFEDPDDKWMHLPAPDKGNPIKRTIERAGILPDQSHNYLVKRVIGLPGDHVKCCSINGSLLVNGHEVQETYIKGAPSDFPFEVNVPEGRYFMMGDNRSNSNDSRCHLPSLGIDAFIPGEDIVGPVRFKVFGSIPRSASLASIPMSSGVNDQTIVDDSSISCGD